MTFAQILNGSQVFLDANTLVYNAVADPKFGAACKLMLERVARREIEGFISSHVLCDLAHRVMTVEAMTHFGWLAKGIAPRLRQQPAAIQQLTRFRQAVEEIPRIGIQVLSVDFSLVARATTLSQQHGLLTGDALIVAIMEAHRLIHLASNDADFDRVPGLVRYAPA